MSFDLKILEHQWRLFVTTSSAEDLDDARHLQTSETSSAITPQLIQFAVACIKLYKVARLHTTKLHKFDPDPGDAALVLAAEALATATKVSGLQKYDVIGASLLQFLLEESEYNSKARMALLVRLQGLGMHTLAAKAYLKLGVKGVLHESCDVLFFTRLSVYHPKATRDFKPFEAISKGLKFYADSLNATTDYQSVALDEQNYGSVIRFQHFQERLRDSPTRRLLWLERRRIARLTNTDPDEVNFAFGKLPELYSRPCKGG